jgi:hypothetical protein
MFTIVGCDRCRFKNSGDTTFSTDALAFAAVVESGLPGIDDDDDDDDNEDDSLFGSYAMDDDALCIGTGSVPNKIPCNSGDVISAILGN